jgi:hypothetical protein
LANRSATRVLVYSRWPRQDDPSRPGGPRDYDTLWLRSYPEGGTNANESAEFFKELTAALRAASVNGVALADRVFMVPVGQVLYELNQQMKAGQVPGYSGIFDLYADGIHLTSLGSYVVACTFFGVIYGESPVGLPVPSVYGAIDPVLAQQIQETIWNVLQTEPLSGVPSDGNLILATLAVPPAYRGNPYSTTLLAVGGFGARTFSVSAGSLPPGLNLSANGVLSGVPGTAGMYPFSITVSDSTTPQPLRVERSYVLNIDVDTDPVILTDAQLPGIHRGGRYDLTLAVEGGNGTRKWSLVSGALPPGLVLGEGGVLLGSALQEGLFSFTLKVEDSDIPPDSDTRAFTLEVAPPSPQTVMVDRTVSPVRIDGELAESHWALNQELTAIRQGFPDNRARFAVLWDDFHLYIAIRVEDDYLSLGSGVGNQQDAIEIFLDAFNDKQAEFNVQHRQLRLTLDGLLSERGGRLQGIEHALLFTDAGYQAEIAIPWSNLGITPVADETVIGLDVSNSDADALGIRQHFISFAAANPDAPRPSEFGSAILTSSTVAGTGGEPPPSSGDQPILYEPFNYASGALHLAGANNSAGFASLWSVQNNQSDPTGFAVSEQDTLKYGMLATEGRSMTGGIAYLNAGRALDVTGAFADWRRQLSPDFRLRGLDIPPIMELSLPGRPVANGGSRPRSHS